jgi:diketogulonate reductase-like aldo/keto reductase
VDSVTSLLNLFKSYGYKSIDSAYTYPAGGVFRGQSELVLGQVENRAEFDIDTKLNGLPGAATETGVISSLKESMERLKTPIRTYLIHGPGELLSLVV